MVRLEKWSRGLGFALMPLMSVATAHADVSSLRADVERLARDELAGRVTDQPGSALAREYIVSRLEATGYLGNVDSYPLAGGGTNVLALLPGKGALASEYILLGAHYDHVALGPLCQKKGDEDDVLCNGATDNAAGVAVLMDIAAELAKSPPSNRRGVYFAFWDREESDMGGSVALRNAALPPWWPQPVAYLNYDIQGANLVTSLSSSTFAIGASSGGSRLASAVTAAAAPEGAQLRMRHLTEVFGQYRSDYATYLSPVIVNKLINPALPAWLPRVPTVFLTDSNGPCYHTTQDELAVVDVQKLARQARTGLRLARDLATGTKPTIQPLPLEATAFRAAVGPLVGLTAPYPPIPPPTFADAVELLDLARTASADPELDPAAKAQIEGQLPALQEVVNRGRWVYNPLIDGATVALAALVAVPALEQGACRGFLAGE